jgi:hypothetical protein
MTDQLLEQLASHDPVSRDLPAIPLHLILAQVDGVPQQASDDRPGRGIRPRRILTVGLASLSVLVVIAVIVVVLNADHSSTRSPANPRLAHPVVDLNVFRRPQTAKDQTLFSSTRRAARRDRLGAGFANDWLAGVIPSQTRFVRTISGGREVFLAALTSGTARGLVHNPDARPIRTRDGEVALKLIIVAPDGKPAAGQGPIRQPIAGAGLGEVNNRIASIEARSGGGCSGSTIWSPMPNGIARVRWQFPRQDRYGNIYATSLSVTVSAQDNVAVATIHGRASCAKPTVTTLYNSNGQIVHRYGNPATLTRVHGRDSGQNPSNSFCQQNPSACPTPTTKTPRFPTNAAGETYGSASGLLPSQEPDLVAVTGQPLHGLGHISGYVRETQLNADSCGNVKTPRAAVRCTRTDRHLNRAIPVYKRDGTTIIGSFTVGGS